MLFSPSKSPALSLSLRLLSFFSLFFPLFFCLFSFVLLVFIFQVSSLISANKILLSLNNCEPHIITMQLKFILAVAFSIAGVPAASTYCENEPRLRQNSAPKPAPVPGRYKTAPLSFFTGTTQPVKLQGNQTKFC